MSLHASAASSPGQYGTGRPSPFLDRVPVRLRLLGATLIALTAITAVGAVGLMSTARERVALGRIGQLAAAHDRFLGAQLECSAIRADVLAVLSATGSRQPERTALLTHIEACRRDLLTAVSGSMPEDFRKAVADFRPLLTDYLDRATAIAWLDSNDLSSVEHRDGFEHASEALALARRRIDAIFDERATVAGATADRLGLSGLWLVTGAWLLAITIVAAVARVVATSISQALSRVQVAALAIAEGDLTVRCDTPVHDDVGAVAGSVNRMADALQTTIARLQTEQEQDAFSRQLAEALDMADTEVDTYAVVARGMQSVSGDIPMELLVADSSRAHLERATVHPQQGAPCCAVESPYGCMAVRRGNPIVFETSDALNACARLRDRPGGPVSAVCVPLNFMGRALGVLHATGEPGHVPTQRVIGQLTTLGILAGGRIGTVRAFERTQLQASTDGLTGLLNRRSIESRVRQLTGKPYAVAIADVDEFKRLNDTLGHDAGDRVLRVLGDVLRQLPRGRHHVARWGGEEFVLVLEEHDARSMFDVAEQIRANFTSTCRLTHLPQVTVSFGIADSTMGSAFEQLMRIADDALYQSKETGRNRTTIGDPTRVPAVVPRRDADHLASVQVEELTTII